MAPDPVDQDEWFPFTAGFDYSMAPTLALDKASLRSQQFDRD
jgi:hypothetical protein